MACPPEKLAAARRAKQHAQERYGRASWFRGVGLVPHGDGLAVRLNVAPTERGEAPALPKELEGIPVEIVYTKGYSRR